jgi:hypothetical protein
MKINQKIIINVVKINLLRWFVLSMVLIQKVYVIGMKNIKLLKIFQKKIKLKEHKEIERFKKYIVISYRQLLKERLL